MLRLFPLGLALALAPAPASFAQDCKPVDMFELPLVQTDDLVANALQAAYPGSRLAGGVFTAPDGATARYLPDSGSGPQTRLTDATIGDQFHYPYPLAFEFDSRKAPYFDPGRPRNDAFFRALYFDDKKTARQSLKTVTFQGKTRRARFHVTTKHCVDVQLRAAFELIQRHSPDIDVFFAKSGGSFNWRKIAGTDRLSAHSFGIAVDFNTKLGGYWRWSGAKPGKATHYDNKFPLEIVEAMERFGFIWGGKWHHFDGMHFEYRPELILYARLQSER